MDGFTSLNELYTRLKPALKSKCKDLNRVGINYVKEIDIWNYLRVNNWVKRTNLTLGEMVNDIMCLNNNDIISYVHNIMANRKSELNNDEN